jgi:dTDP-4-dehydrorhamnose reductase
MAPRILITGGSGLLALNWAFAVKNRFKVILGLHDRVVSIAGIDTIKIDLKSVDGLVRVFEMVEPQMVIHTAGLTSVEKCEAEPALSRYINVDLASNVAKACARLNLPLAHISTDHLFSGRDSFVDEMCPVAAVNVYGRTKAEAEFVVLESHSLALVLRVNFYGWGPNYRSSFSDLVVKTLRTGKELTLFTDVFYTPIIAESVTNATHDLIDLNAKGIFHIVGDERISKYEFGLKIAKQFDLDPHLIKPGLITDRVSLVQRPREMSLSNEKVIKLLGRKLGGVGEHIERLHQQERNGLTLEMQKL